MTSQFRPEPLRWYLQGSKIAVEKKQKKNEESGPKDVEYEALLEKMPWLVHLDEAHGFVQQAEKVSKKAVGSSDREVPTIDVDPDVLMDALATIDKAKIVEAGLAIERGTCDFKSSECYGESNVEKGYEFHDAVQGKCCHSPAEKWARDRKLQVTYKATFTKHTEAVIRVLVRS